MSIQESNKLIAEFMGGTFNKVYENCWHFPSPPEFEGTLGWVLLHYHESFGWIMPVIDRIQRLEKGRFYFTIDPWSMMLVDYEGDEKEIFILEFTNEDCLLDRYYQSVTKFIEWYNSQPSNTK